MKRIAILGSTGSIGESALRVVLDSPDRFRVVALAAGRRVDRLLEQVRQFKPDVVSVTDPAAAAMIREELPGPGLRVLSGDEGLRAVATDSGADLVLSALVGAAGLAPTLAAIEAGITTALANKESLVMAGEVMTAAAARSGAAILPVDSEHAALHQILEGKDRDHVKRLIVTASGGPFRTTPAQELARVTPEQALKHPTWAMGDKITIDSATLANKALEVIEARFLFGIPPERIDVVVHPQSIVHALVEFVDGTLLAQLGVTDMRSPIQYALDYPDRFALRLPALDLVALRSLEFEAPDLLRFPALALGFAAARSGGTAAAVFNAANEIANAAFRERRLDFNGIPVVIEGALAAVPVEPALELEVVLDADRQARETAVRLIAERDGARRS